MSNWSCIRGTRGTWYNGGSAARYYSLCVRLHSSGMRPAVYCLRLRVGIPNENHDNTEQISDTTDLVHGYRLRTDDVVRVTCIARATCIRGVRTTSACVISNREYTHSQYFDRVYYCTVIILLYVPYECVPVVSTIEPACIGPHSVETSMKRSCRLKVNQTSKLTIEYE